MTTRGLEPAGVDLQAKGFQQYIKQLSAIDKQQQAIFNQEFKGLGVSYSRVTAEAKRYEAQLNRTRAAQDRLARANELNRSLAQLSARQRQLSGFQLPGGLGTLGTAGIAAGAVALARAVRDASKESAIAAANFNAQVVGINNLAASYGQSGAAIRSAMREASQGVLSESAIIRGANQALLLGVAKTPEQFAEVTRTALILGRTMGLDATQAIEQFNTALGRKSLLILDNFGISSKAVNAELDRLAQQRFGETAQSLSQVQRDSLFVEAALKIAGQAADTIGDGAIAAAGDFDRLTASAENLKIAFGEATLPFEAGLARIRADMNTTLAQMIVLIDAGIRGFDDFFIGIARAAEKLPDFEDILKPGAFDEFFEFLNEPLREQAPDLFEDVRDRLQELTSTVFGAEFAENDFTSAVEENTEALEQNEELIKSLQNAIKQAEQLELSFARAAEDAARRLGRQQAKLARDQFKDRINLLNDQAKEFDEFQKDELKSVQEAEAELNEAREKAGKERLREQDKLHRELRQARERFNLDAIQSQRRFDLQDRRLRAAGDILALQELREDFSLQQQEAKENFDLQNRQRKEDAKDQTDVADERRQEQISELEQELKDLQDGLDQRRTEFLQSQEEEFNNLLAAQAEQRLALRESYLEQQEDARINQQRQLEDLGRSLADQQDLTAEGAMRIAEELEAIFGQEGVADTILSGFTTRSESEFRDLFNEIEEIVKSTNEAIAETTFGAGARGGLGANPSLQLGQIPSFHQGGVVPGPRGSEQTIRALGGETVLPTHQMNAPLIPSQTLNVNMSGGFNISGGEGVSMRVKQEAINEMTEAFEIAVRRLGRRF